MGGSGPAGSLAAADFRSVYLTHLPETLAFPLIDLIDVEVRDLIRGHFVADQPPIQPAIGLVKWEEHKMDVLRPDDRVIETDRQAIVLARRGQGLFKERVMRNERSCRIVGVTWPEH